MITRARLVLSLFPGIGLFDRAFEQAGFTIVRGPDALWGGDIRNFHVPAGVFGGVIGGPPCQRFSTAGNIVGSEALDLVPEFVRIVREAAPLWGVMENVRQTAGHPAIPRGWIYSTLRDYDCGGETERTRAFWHWPFLMLAPSRAPGDAAYSVLASTWKRGGSRYAADKGFLAGNLPVAEYARLQGAEDVGAALKEFGASRAFAVHVLGNGVPLAMGRHIAAAARAYVEHAERLGI